jgi:hypothetical protein
MKTISTKFTQMTAAVPPEINKKIDLGFADFKLYCDSAFFGEPLVWVCVSFLPFLLQNYLYLCEVLNKIKLNESDV